MSFRALEFRERMPFRSIRNATQFKEPQIPRASVKRVIQLWGNQADNEALLSRQVRVSGGMTDQRIKIVRRVEGGE